MADSRPGRQRLPLHPGQTFLCSVLFFLPALIPPLFGWLNGFLAVPVVFLLSSRGAGAGSLQLQLSLLAAGLAALFTGRIEGFLFSLTLVPLGYSLHRSALAGASPAMSGGRGGLGRSGGCGSRRGRRRGRRARATQAAGRRQADLDDQRGAEVFLAELFDTAQVAVAQPLAMEIGGRHEAHPGTFVARLFGAQGQDPGLELLGRQLLLQAAEAMRPERSALGFG